MIGRCNAKAHTGADLQLPAAVLFWPKAPRSKLWGRDGASRTSPDQNLKETRSLNKMNIIRLVLLGRKNCFHWHVSSSTWKREWYVMAKPWKTVDRRLSVGCCPSFVWSSFNTATFFLHKIAGLLIGFFSDIRMVPHPLSRTSYRLSQENFSLGAWTQAHIAFSFIYQDLAFVFVWLFACSCSFCYSYICVQKILWVICWYAVP